MAGVHLCVPLVPTLDEDDGNFDDDVNNHDSDVARLGSVYDYNGTHDGDVLGESAHVGGDDNITIPLTTRNWRALNNSYVFGNF